jgi:L-fuconolactonase
LTDHGSSHAGTERPKEETLEPALPIVDPHHHFRDRAGDRYLFPDMLADAAAGHKIVATIAVECGTMYRAHGDPDVRPIGETEFLNGIAAMSASGAYGPTAVVAGIIAFADLSLGERVRPILEAVLAAGGGRVRGIRNPVAWHESPELRQTRVAPGPGRLLDRTFRAGVACLKDYGLPLDLWLYHPQLAELADLASALPGVRFVVNHVGGPLGEGLYAGQRDAVFADWSRRMRDLARAENVCVKLGGLGMPIMGFGLDRQSAGSAELAKAWRPYLETCIEAFGVERCMFESNFPPDHATASYHTLWNAFKRITAGASEAEKLSLFGETARQVYRLSLPA